MASEGCGGAREPGGSPAVLVVDDDPRVREMIAWALEGEGIPVETAADRRGALERAARRRPALLILDLTLPGDSGEAVASALRAAGNEPLPVLVITADGRAADKAGRVGAFGYLRKPFEVTDLIAAVRRGLGAP